MCIKKEKAMDKGNKLKITLCIATLLVPSVLLSMNPKKRRRYLEEQRLKQSIKRKTVDAQPKISPTKPTTQISEEPEISPTEPTTQISENKNKELMEQFEKIRVKAANELPKSYEPTLKEINNFRETVKLASTAGDGITQEQTDKLYELINKFITQTTNVVIQQITKEVNTLAVKFIAKGVVAPFKEAEIQKNKFLIDPEERKDVESLLNKILVLISDTAQYSNEILKNLNYVFADDKYTENLKINVKKLSSNIILMRNVFSSYINHVFKRTNLDYINNKEAILIAITELIPIINKIELKLLTSFAGL